jgi:hypothetical protein
MDELTLLRNFRHDAPGPSAAETAAARARLLKAIDDPQAGASRLTTSRRRAAVLGVLGRRKLWAPVAAAAAVTAVAMAAAVIAAAGPQTARPVSPSGSRAAASMLREAAAAAARQPPGHGRYFAAEIETVDNPGNPGLTCCDRSGVSVTIQWFGNGVIGRLAGLDGRTIAEFPEGIYFGSYPRSPHGLTWAQLQRLPTAPRRLQAVIAQASRSPRIVAHRKPGGRVEIAEGSGFGPPQVATEFGLIAELLAWAPAPPALRSALYQVDAMLPGLALVPHAWDPIGRVAAEVYMPAENTPGADATALYFNPSTGAVLDLAAEPSRCSGVWGSGVLASGYVSSDRQLPAGGVRAARPIGQPFKFPECAKSTMLPSPTFTTSPMPASSPSPTALPSSTPTSVTVPTRRPPQHLSPRRQ